MKSYLTEMKMSLERLENVFMLGFLFKTNLSCAVTWTGLSLKINQSHRINYVIITGG